MTTTLKVSLGLAPALFALLALAPAQADADAAGDVKLFSISKSENRNQVVYAVRVDGDCRPTGAAPVHAYWQDLERGPAATSPLLWIEQPAYGLSSQEVVPAAADGSREVRVRLRALPERPIVVRTTRNGSSCEAAALTTIGAVPALLYNVHAQLRRLFGVESIAISGRRFDTSTVVRETLRP